LASLRKLRKRILTPPLTAASVATRGFHTKTTDSVRHLETIGHSFLRGYGYAVEMRTVDEARNRLETVSRPYRGFAYEGAAMGYAVLDGISLGNPYRTRQFLLGPGAPHIYMAYVGIGWACARLPRWRWRRVLPDDDLLGWLVLDGYGFHQAYFHTRRYVHQHHQDAHLPRPSLDPYGYATRAVDQGIGRALWFVEGTDPDRVASRIGTFPASRRADLWSGAGLAATYAGGCDEAELQAFWQLAGDHRPNVAQASAFAAEARVRAGLVTDHTELATRMFCGTSAEDAAETSRQLQTDLPVDGPTPAYEVWRSQLAQRFETHGRW
jgi:enediyne biosynthesis protein E3